MDIKPGDSVAAYRKVKSNVLFNVVVGPAYEVRCDGISILNNRGTNLEKVFELSNSDWTFKVLLTVDGRDVAYEKQDLC